ncbi:polyribonucleotide nucleotidyltransferase [Desulfurispira natronophila]|uniref:Polyribonucleotide nucleotidyltransferase n=1 Tax=Desulfurispira natronophila TaxID=682562 RepID=A0A7W7Y2W6_9BACT|nr:polyribonucleotide nucleotidyltransferase [Desulfurispira natronophila]MBB5021073.1 polyribonucleotide nucleotidyltransferase [Desulfurispira natronophila]
MESISVEFGGRTIEMQTGQVARQATSSVLLRDGDNVVLVTVVSNKEPREGIDFFPLTVNYIEKRYSSGRIPGGFKKREGMPSDDETLISRLIDRPLRPLFPDGYFNETQVIATVMSSDAERPLDMLAMYGAATALHISDVPFAGPMGSCRIGRIDGEFVLNPSYEEIERSDMDVALAATREAILMVEAGANEVPDQEMLDAIAFGHQAIQTLLDTQEEFRSRTGDAKREFTPHEVDAELKRSIEANFRGKIEAALALGNKMDTYAALDDAKKEFKEHYTAALGEEGFAEQKKTYMRIFGDMEREVMRSNILDKGVRADGRSLSDVRAISIEPSFLPRTHGSVLFTRGETQAIVTTTLGTGSDEQFVETLQGEHKSDYLFHYNFPPYCVGEAGFLRAPGRREIGHGALAKRAIEPILPGKEDFPYTVRVVSEITESNGSSSMASACGASLALMDAGVPVSGAVSGIAMGLILEGERFAILSDILGIEDHLGDMDFKVAGTAKGITALQMDIKIVGITQEIMRTALDQALAGRQHIMNEMDKALDAPRPELNPHAPRIVTIMVKPDKIRDIIGVGGKIIRGIVEETGAKIDIEDDGRCLIASANSESLNRAIAIIEGILEEPEIGKTYRGKVKKIAEFGAFVEFLPNQDGLLHISQMDHRRVEKVTDILQEGDELDVQLIEVDHKTGKYKLSRKALIIKPAGMDDDDVEQERRPRKPMHARKNRN